MNAKKWQRTPINAKKCQRMPKIDKENQKRPKNVKKSRIQETPTLSTDADSRTNTHLKRLNDLYIFFCGQKKKLGGGQKK